MIFISIELMSFSFNMFKKSIVKTIFIFIIYILSISVFIALQKIDNIKFLAEPKPTIIITILFILTLIFFSYNKNKNKNKNKEKKTIVLIVNIIMSIVTFVILLIMSQNMYIIN